MEVYDISEGVIVQSIPLQDPLGSAVTPRELLFVDFASSTDKLFVTSDRGLVFAISEGASSVSQTITLASTNKELPALAVAPEENFLFVVNATDTVLHVINAVTGTEVDTDTSSAATTPISLAPNAGLKSVVVTEVEDPDDTYAFVSGTGGISVIDLNLGTSSFDGFTVIDFSDGGASDDEDDPLETAASPGLLVVSSVSEGFLFSSNSDATLSIVSDNPFVTVSATSLGTASLTQGASFTVTFQSDEAGSYEVRVGGAITASGSLVASGSVATADTDVTTDAITYDASVFAEGTNRVFVFVTDSEGNRGRDAVDITVDTPPGDIVITETSFGNGRIYVTFNRLTASDIARYNIYLDPDATVIGTKTDASVAVTQPGSGDTVTGEVEGLTNETDYFIGVAAVDDAGNIGPRTPTLSSGAGATARPEVTEGIAGSFGEGGCSLLPGGQGSWPR